MLRATFPLDAAMDTPSREQVLRRSPHHLVHHLSHDLCHHLTLPVATAVALAVLGTSVPAPADAAGSGSARVGRAFFGMHDASQLAYHRVAFGSLRIWDAGATWRDMETSPGRFDWSRLDSLVSQAQDHGGRVTFVPR